MKLINKDQVSHITVFNETEGIWSTKWGYWMKLSYVPYRKHKWWESDKETKEGYWEDGNANGAFSAYRSKNQIDNEKGLFIKENSVWTYPFIQIFSGGKSIHTEYFKTYQQVEKHLEANYSNVNIKYND